MATHPNITIIRLEIYHRKNIELNIIEDSSSLIVPLEGGGFLCLICNKEASTKGKRPMRLDITDCLNYIQLYF